MHHRRAPPQIEEYTFHRDPFLPLQPTWFRRIPALLATLQAENAPQELTRREIEELFGVRRRRAILLLHRCGASRRGLDLIATRDSVVAYLEQQWNEEAAASIAAQERQVAETLAEARRALTLPTIPLPPPKKLSAITFAGLPADIQLTRSELSLTFSSAQDLIEKLFTLAQAFANDYESLERALNDANPTKRPGHGLSF